MSPLLRHPAAGRQLQRITARDAGWSHVGFEVMRLAAGETFERDGDVHNELCLVIVEGFGALEGGGLATGRIGRETPFDPTPDCLYLPPRTPFKVTAETTLELAICAAPATGRLPARIIAAGENAELVRGTGTNTRIVRNIMPEDAPGEELLVVEVVTPGGHWSSYPPHKHDTASETETYLEESYYHRLRLGRGFAVQRVYTDDLSLDETLAVGDRDVVLVPRGYHPVGAPHGFDLYYLNVMAGPVRAWKFTMAPEHAHLPY
jgi:5-deoxy-glucuronate isomerase